MSAYGDAHERPGGHDGDGRYESGAGRGRRPGGHDGDGERTFAALPAVRGAGFARTWWGRAWLRALEDTALDGKQLKAGRQHARAGTVGAVSVRPGRITAVVQGRDGTAHRSDVLVQELSGEEWDRLVDLAVDSAGHIAALLDRELPPHLVEDAAAAGLELLPGIGDLEPECTCGAWDHCPHTAALCYQVARLLDEDPFILLLLRGRGERALVAALQERSAARAADAAGIRGAGGADTETWSRGAGPAGMPGSAAGAGAAGPAGVSAAEAFAARDILPPLPAPPVPAETPGEPPSLDTESAPGPEVDPAALEFLVADAAARAHRMLSGAGAVLTDPPLTVDQDAIRLASGAPSGWIAARLAEGSGRTREELELAVTAWGFGGSAALDVLEGRVFLDAGALRRAEARLATAWDADDRPVLRGAGPGRWAVVGGDGRLRLGADGRWWPYREKEGRWVPAGPATQDPAAALAMTAR
ncbi:SWF or SNF family helicase [Streptomyces sp. NPDC048718]|uniref:SWIM zinc finger family protein n=1 Tax=Streptomyces sp. NPDC048718 TaxID=3365587 RepID=UPI003717BC64